MRRTASEAAETRVELLRAAIQCFGELGWKGATVERIASQAGVTRGAFHHHFRDKRALLTEALEWGWAAYADQLFGSTIPDDLEAYLTQMLITYVRLLQEDGLFQALANTSVVVAPQAFPESIQHDGGIEEWHQRLTSVIKGLRPTVVATPPALTASLVIVLIQGFTVSAVTRPQDLPAPSHRDQAIRALVRGLLQ